MSESAHYCVLPSAQFQVFGTHTYVLKAQSLSELRFLQIGVCRRLHSFVPFVGAGGCALPRAHSIRFFGNPRSRLVGVGCAATGRCSATNTGKLAASAARFVPLLTAYVRNRRALAHMGSPLHPLNKHWRSAFRTS